MENNRKKVKEIQKQIVKLQNVINKIEEKEENEVQKPRCRKMVEWYLKSIYSNNMYAKILDTVEPKNGLFFFIMEEIYLFDNGGGQILTTNHYPYLNKEWWETEVPISGFERISEERYLTEKVKVLNEMATNNRLKKFLLKNNLK